MPDYGAELRIVDHTEIGKKKTAGRTPAVFHETRLWSGGTGLNVADGPIPWRAPTTAPFGDGGKRALLPRPS